MQGFLGDEPDRAMGEARIEECMKQVVEVPEQHSTTLVFEPVNHLQAGFHNSPSEVMALATRIASPRFKPMLDTFHINTGEKSMTEPIFRAGRELAHFHVCESNGSLLGSGHLNFQEILGAPDAIGYAGYASVKVCRQPWAVGAEASMRYLTELNLAGAGPRAAQIGTDTRP
jgi:D-psicose/D-tagatose/L-ribulose 3-epimerase